MFQLLSVLRCFPINVVFSIGQVILIPMRAWPISKQNARVHSFLHKPQSRKVKLVSRLIPGKRMRVFSVYGLLIARSVLCEGVGCG